MQRKALTPNDFPDLEHVQQRLAAFERLYNEIAEPFAWNFTREKLNAWLARLTAPRDDARRITGRNFRRSALSYTRRPPRRP